MGLTVKRVARLKQPGRYFDSNGLYLQVLSASNRSWLLRYELRGKKRWMGLGSTETFSLEEARQRARAARQLLSDKIDPLDARRDERARQAAAAARDRTFAAVTKEYHDAHEAEWSPKHRTDFLASFKYATTLDALLVSAVDEALVLSVLQPIWGTKTITTKRLMQRIASVLDYAAAAGYRKRGDNPA